MKKITGYVKDYFICVDKRILFLSAGFIAFAIFCNYHFNLNSRISALDNSLQYLSWYCIFLFAFSFAYFLFFFFNGIHFFNNARFIVLLLVAPCLFAWKMAYDVHFFFSSNAIENIYWNHIIYWPFKLAVITALVWVIWKLMEEKQVFYGLTLKNLQLKPYLFMLLLMVPLIAAASTQHDFLTMYPKLKSLSYLTGVHNKPAYKLLFELSYGSDFFGIELFFRGFLVLAFVKWFGRDAILPMACFYCTIHFGKPLGECISSFFGGLILGIVTYNTRTIFGGLMVHLGIAWMMELGGYIGNHFFFH